MKLKEAQKFAEHLMEQIRPFCDRLVVAGSIRRKKSEVRDVDLVLIPKPLLWHRIVAALQRNLNAKVLKHGEKAAQLTIDGINVDLYSATEETWEPLLLIRTGSAEHNIKLAMIAQKKGMKLSHKGLIKDGKVVATTEKEIFNLLNMQPVRPEDRT
jgi:DNA polymerase/3'-5' exonuclease PolX